MEESLKEVLNLPTDLCEESEKSDCGKGWRQSGTDNAVPALLC